MKSLVITRYHRPTMLDKAPYGTRYKCILQVDSSDEHSYEKNELFVQTSINAEEPVWMNWSDILGAIYKDMFYEEKLFDKYMNTYKNLDNK